MPRRDQSKSKKFDFLVGLSIDGYTLLELVGHGHYGAVFRATEPRKQATVAIKAMRAPKPGSPKEALLENELEALRRLRTTRTATYLHKVVNLDGIIFLVMNFCEGGDLLDPIIRDRRFIGDSALVSRVFGQMLVAVGDAHEVDFAHRDVKPENFLCDEGLERIWLADFGLATQGRETGKFGRGTPAYLPPEGWLPALETVDAFQGDVFALGVTLFQMLYGEFPWCRAVTDDRHWEDFVSFPADFFENCDNWAGMRGAPPLTPEAHALLSAALEPQTAVRIDLPEFRRRFHAIDEFFTLPHVVDLNTLSIVEVLRTPGLASDDTSEQDSDAGPATPSRTSSQLPPGAATAGMFRGVYGDIGRSRKGRQPSTGIRAWVRRLMVRPPSSSASP